MSVIYFVFWSLYITMWYVVLQRMTSNIRQPIRLDSITWCWPQMKYYLTMITTCVNQWNRMEAYLYLLCGASNCVQINTLNWTQFNKSMPKSKYSLGAFKYYISRFCSISDSHPLCLREGFQKKYNYFHGIFHGGTVKMINFF